MTKMIQNIPMLKCHVGEEPPPTNTPHSERDKKETSNPKNNPKKTQNPSQVNSSQIVIIAFYSWMENC